MRLERDVVLVTGASAGVGRAISLAFARRGNPVALLARDEGGLRATKEAVEAADGRALVLPADVADAQAVEAAAARCESELGPIAIWVNNAMATLFAPFHEVAADEFERVTAVTFLGTVNGTRSALARMRGRDAGVIVQVGSALAYQGIPLQAAYCAAKHAARGFSDALRAELRHDGSRVRITTVHLPAVNTPQFSWARSRLDREPRPLAPIFAPEVAARAVLFAAERGWREVHVGHSSTLTVLGSRIAPSLLEAHVAKAAWGGQHGEAPAPGAREGNLFAPVSGGHATAGRFSEDARERALPFWLTTFPLISAATALLVVAFAAALVAGLRAA